MTLPERIVFIVVGVLGVIDGVLKWRNDGHKRRGN